MSERAVFSESIDESCCQRFENAWFEGRRVAIATCLPEATDARYLPTLLELALIEMELAWKAASGLARQPDGELFAPPALVEQYLERFPVLDQPDLALRLVRHEYALRRRYGQAASVADFISRFPQLPLQDALQPIGDPPSPDPERGEPTQPHADAVTLALDEEPPTAPSTPALAPRAFAAADIPARIGRYRILSVLGEGGFGRVYLAEDTELQRRVAIKTPNHRRLASGADIEAYLAEARNVARLDHPGIVPVYDVGRTTDGACYVVAKYIEGCDLADWREERSPSPAESLEVIIAVAEALHHAHRRGLVHRDIKPGNILIDLEGRPHLVDFGLALRDEQYGQGPQLAGTPAYMSVEQARSESHLVDARSDIFSLGVVLYELLTGHRPFRAKTLADLREQLTRGVVRPPRQFNDALPRDLDRICLRALAKNPADRYSTALDFADELRDVLAALTLGGSTQAVRGRSEGASGPHRESTTLAGLRRLDFSAELARWGENFVGRQWLLNEFHQWLETGRERVFLALGDPGAGKSALLAHVIQHEPRVAAHHFCVASLAESLDPLRFVQSLAAQLAERLAGFRAVLASAPQDSLESEDAGTLFRRLVADPLRQQPGESPLLIVVDALDESLEHGERHIARLLYERMNDLPPRVRLLVSARQSPEVCDLLARSRKVELRAEQPENLDDVARYIETRLREPRLASSLGGSSREIEDAIQFIAEKAAGNFLYAAHVLDAIAAGQIDARRPESFPEGLVGIYHEFFAQRYPTRQGFAQVRPVLDVVTAAREPLTADQIAEFLDRDPFEVEELLEPLAPFFPQREGKYRPFHKSVTDWLCGAAGQSRTHRVDVRGGHRRIAENLRRRLEAGRIDGLTLDHLPAHLVAAGCGDELYTVLTDIRFLTAKAKAGEVFELCRDLTGASAHLPEGDPRRRLLDLLGEAVCTEMHFLAQYPQMLFSCLWNRAWWYDVPQAARHYDDPPEGWTAPPPWSRPGPRLSDLIESMRSRRRPNEPWLRALRPPKVHLGTAQQAVYRGHTGEVWCVAVSPDGQLLATGGKDRTVCLWSTQSGALLQTLKAHRGVVTAVAFSGDGELLVSGGCDGAVIAWRVETGEAVARYDEASEVRCLAFSPQERLLAYGCKGGQVKFWRIASESGPQEPEYIPKPIDAHHHVTYCVAFSPDGSKLVTGGADTYFRVWDVRSGRRLLHSRKAHRRCVHAAAFSPDGQTILTAGRDNEVRLWDARTGEPLGVFEGHENEIRHVAFSPDGRRALSASNDRTVRLWDVACGHALACFRGHGHTVWQAAFSRDGEKFFSASGDRTVRVWNPRRGGSLAVLRAHQVKVTQLAFSPDGRQIASGAVDGEVRLWDVESGVEAHRLAAHMGKPISRLLYSHDGRWLFSAGFDGKLGVWSPVTGEAIAVLTAHERGINDVALSADGRRLLTASGDATVRLWETDTWREVGVLTGHDNAVWCAAFSPDGARLATSGRDGAVRIYDAASLEPVLLVDGLEWGASALAFSPDGYTLATGHKNATVRRWDATTGQPLSEWEGHRDAVCRVVFSADGRRLATSEEEGATRVWDVETGECVDMIRAADPDAMAGGPEVFPYRAVRRTTGAAGVVIEDSRTRQPQAFYPPRLWRLTSSPTGRHWAGVAGRHLYLFCLEPVNQSSASVEC